MNLNKKNKAFSLIELMVAISIIGIIALGATSLDFNRLNNKQKIEIYINKIKSNIENVRNKALSGKGIGTNLTVPKKWEMGFSKTNSGTIETKAFTDSSVTPIFSNTFIVKKGYNIPSIKCGKIGQSELDYEELTYTGTIQFTGGDIKLLIDPSDEYQCGNNESRILLITVRTINDIKKLKINVLNGLIEIK